MVSATTSQHRTFPSGFGTKYNAIPSGTEHILVALDLKSAFDAIGYNLILQELSSSNCGERIDRHIRSFLTDRTAAISLGAIISSAFHMLKIESIPDLGYALYADDTTLSATRGSLGHKEATLQEAADSVSFCGELRKTEIEQADTLIRTTYKAALGLPNATSTDRLLAFEEPTPHLRGA
ncbi:hypothetical protein HPB52_018144 [Rhipicephalus sanguineus]|uniref:Reverse transcriptase domain-containing protein n=1 Tax=Rhipicephalus sanguineus TaxID=34632 RepID=A0A9D4SYU7_RHISA|nr:hypothetical protein HPB52_018144 [Rhipicephalus sanguineus]